MKIVALALVCAVIVEGLVSYAETIYDYFEQGDVKKAIKQIGAIVLAILFAFQIKVTLIAFLADAVVSPVFDMIVSGIFMSRGANYLFDFIKMIGRVSKFDYEEFEEFDEDELDEDFDEDQDVLILDSVSEYEGVDNGITNA